MDIQPNSTIKLYGDIGLIPGSEDTRYFPNENAKNTWFDSQTVRATLQANTYVRRGRNVIRVSTPMSVTYACQYMRFLNDSFERKWFCAFITNIEYVNNGACDIYYEIDVMMTWMGTFTLGQCLVERESTVTDNYYEHLVEENLPTGDYVIRKQEFVEINSDPRLVLSVARNSEHVGATGLYRGNIVSGAEYFPFDISDSGKTDLEAKIDELLEDPNGKDAIISANIVFGKMIPQSYSSDQQGLLKPLNPVNYSGQWFSSAHPIGRVMGEDAVADLTGYTPKNKKLYNYPYCVMAVTNQEGSENEYRYEFFSDHAPHFYWFGICADVPEACIIPTQYKGSGVGYVEDEMMTMKQFPQASMAIDQYKAYVAQMTSGGGYTRVAGKVVGQVLNSLSGAVGTGIGALNGFMGASNPTQMFTTMTNAIGGASSNALGLTGGLLDTAINLLADKQYYQAIPDAVLGSANSCLMMGINHKFFNIFHKSITAEYAKVIDEFFTMYGYRVNRVKTPAMYNRTRFTYVKTSGCNVHGTMPASDARVIEEMFDRGTRFWVSTVQTIGDYSNGNPVRS